MTDNNQPPPQAFTPPKRGSEHYKNLRQEIMGRRPTAPEQEAEARDTTITSPSATTAATAPALNNEDIQTSRFPRLFSFLGNVDIEEGESMDERDFIINLAFKPLVDGLKLTPEQSQLILAHIGELLQEIEEEERVILEEEKNPSDNIGEQNTR